LTVLTLTLLLNSCVRNSVFLITFLLYVLLVRYSIINIYIYILSKTVNSYIRLIDFNCTLWSDCMQIQMTTTWLLSLIHIFRTL